MGLAPKLDYLHGYSVASVFEGDAGAGYGIKFENGVVVAELRPDQEIPYGIVNTALVGTIFSSNETRLRFGVQKQDAAGNPEIVQETWVSFDPLKYTISDPRFPDSVDEPQNPDTVAAMVEEHRQKMLGQFPQEENAVVDFSDEGLDGLEKAAEGAEATPPDSE
jgi:hypothetical protein